MSFAYTLAQRSHSEPHAASLHKGIVLCLSTRSCDGPLRGTPRFDQEGVPSTMSPPEVMLRVFLHPAKSESVQTSMRTNGPGYSYRVVYRFLLMRYLPSLLTPAQSPTVGLAIPLLIFVTANPMSDLSCGKYKPLAANALYWVAWLSTNYVSSWSFFSPAVTTELES